MANSPEDRDLAQLTAAARGLVGSAPYGSLVLWGGRVVHGLRFTTTGADLLSGPGNSLRGSSVAGSGRRPRISPEHPVAGAGRRPEPLGSDSATAEPATAEPVSEALTEPASAGPVDGAAAAAGRRLLVLAPSAFAARFGQEDLACRFQLCGSVPAVSRWVSVAFGGWVSPVTADACHRSALRFADEHPTADLLDLGKSWQLLEIELAEATVRTGRGCVVLDTGPAVELLADAPGRAH